jgi:hypothetical protein
MKLASCLLSAVALSALHAQTIDTGILGEIRDPSGAAIAAATVTILQPTTGLSRTVTTDSGGHYEVRYLVPGNYNVEAKAPGFRTDFLRNNRLDAPRLFPSGAFPQGPVAAQPVRRRAIRTGTEK